MAVKRLLVTGATGFLGTWILRHWRKSHPDDEIWATSDQAEIAENLADKYKAVDLLNGHAVKNFIQKCDPTLVIHLAGLVKQSTLAEHLSVNVLGTENLYESLLQIDHYAEIRVIQAGTAAMYGQVKPEELPIKENNPMRPITAYAISKMTQDYLAQMYGNIHGLKIIRARIFNLIGPGQTDNLVPAAFIKQLKERCDGDSIQVGNLYSRRDFVDVRDVACAFDKLFAKGQPDMAYNIGSGTSVAIRDILADLFSISGLRNIDIKEEPSQMRKKDVPDVFADISMVKKTTGWQPEIPLHESLETMWTFDK
jgi:GDP-4-dehydro-6-deoxy-D-mannose reductase